MTRKRFIYIILYLVCFIVIVQTAYSFLKDAFTLTPDASIFYRSAYDLLNHFSPYTDKTLFTSFNYPPLTALFFVPLLLLPYLYAQIILVVFNVLLLGIILSFSYAIIRHKPSLQEMLFTFTLFLLFFPYRFTVGMGQVNLIAYALFLGSYLLWKKEKVLLGSILCAFAICIKPIFLFLLLFFVIRKSWKWCLYTISILLLLVGITYLPFQKEYITYLTSVVPHLFTTVGREVYYNQGLSGWTARLTGNLFIRSYFPIVGSVILLVSGILLGRKKTANTQLAIIITLLTLVDSLSWQHHFIILLYPFIAIFYAYKNKKSKMVLSILSFIFVAANIATPQKFNTFPLSILLSHTFYGALLLFIIFVTIPNDALT